VRVVFAKKTAPQPDVLMVNPCSYAIAIEKADV
jgi:hypothetical protein